jgi:hypothetical protein
MKSDIYYKYSFILTEVSDFDTDLFSSVLLQQLVAFWVALFSKGWVLVCSS